MRVLLVEDHEDIAKNIQKFMKLENIEVSISKDWKSWLNKAKSTYYDIILLDIMLPKIDGITLCQEIRKIKETPIIMLTAKWEIEDKLQCFNLWADDYLVKPFDLEELLARIKTIRKRFDEPDNFIYKDIKILLDAQKILKKWKEIKLTLKEFQILKYLIEQQWFAVSRTDILNYIRWGEDLFAKDDKLDVYISTIRKKLCKEIIETIKWFWYKINK